MILKEAVTTSMEKQGIEEWVLEDLIEWRKKGKLLRQKCVIMI